MTQASREDRGPFAWLATILAGVLLLIYVYHALFSKKRLPGPLLKVPFFGDTIELSVSDPTTFLFKRFKRYGRVFRVSLLGLDACVIADAEALRPILSGEAAEYLIPVRTFKPLVGSTEFQSKKEIHGPWRKALTVAIMGKGLQGLTPKLRAVVERHVDRWKAAGRLEIFADARRLSMDLALDAISGWSLEGRIDMDWLKEQAVVYLAGLYALPINLPGTQFSRALAAKERLLDALMPVLQQEHEESAAEWAASGGSAPALAAKYLESTDPVSVRQGVNLAFHAMGQNTLRDTALSVLHSLIATVDTTKGALVNSFSLLVMLPDVQDKLYEEQKKVIASCGPELTYQATTEMPYLEATIKECLRILSAASGAFRRLTRDVRVGDVTVPAGTWLWYFAQVMHCADPAVWDADTSADIPAHMDWRNNLEGAFRPERWLSEETKPRWYYAFGSGSHLCVGTSLVYLEFKLLYARLFRSYRLVPEVPDMLKRCSSYFPFVVPAPGTDGVRLVAREQPLA